MRDKGCGGAYARLDRNTGEIVEIMEKQNNAPRAGAPHLDFIDLAKGICILFVVSYHVDQCEVLYRNQSVNNFFMSFRIPFYFMLSGLFISFNSGYQAFFIKKINRLVIPCTFFFCLTMVYAYVFTLVRSKMLGDSSDVIFDSSLYNFLIQESGKFYYPNIPIWFLVSLFTTYLLYLFLDFVTRQNLYIMLALSFVFGIGGYLFGKNEVQIPFYLDSSMTCMPFVAVGNVLRKKTDILHSRNKKLTIGIALICLIATAVTYGGDVTFFRNAYEATILNLYIAGCSGSIAMILLSKLIGRCPVVNYIGRYSIIVLGMHSFFIGLYTPVLTRLIHGNVLMLKALLLVLVVLSCIFCIYAMRKLVPWFVAQKDLIRA